MPPGRKPSGDYHIHSCEFCGLEIEPHDRERPGKYNKRRYCSVSCRQNGNCRTPRKIRRGWAPIPLDEQRRRARIVMEYFGFTAADLPLADDDLAGAR